ncbi:MAG: family 78 glycoside hydrolase catalytic domain [Saprospiraceae bacterium]
MYEATINGKRIGDAYLTPGWTSYNKRLQYQVFDVTDLLNKGENAIGVTLGNGWYRGNLAWERQKNIYGKDVGLLFQMNIQYENGKEEMIISDGSWKCSTGAIRYSEIYHGETIDARKEQRGWNKVGFDDSNWYPVKVVNHSMDNLLATYNEPIKKHETFQPKEIIITPKGETVIDFGQNLVGWVMVKAKGKTGDRIVLSHNEVLDKEGNFYLENLRAAKQQNTYILRGDDEEFFEPHFSWQGFRYVRVDEFPGEIKVENFTAVALYSDMRPAGQFHSSNPLINQLQHNIEWGQRGNFLDVPTDCPQRDERMGWTGDAQAFSRTATFNFDVHNFFAKWLKDLAADQSEDGKVPYVIPHVMGPKHGGSAGWADAATIIPWNMFLVYGDKKILADQYESMKEWVGFMSSNSENYLWNTGFHFGDWLFYSVNDDRDGKSAITDKYYIAQCFYAHSTQLLINAANILGKKEDVQFYSDLLNKIKSAFLNEYITPNGSTISNTQTSYVLALQFDLLPENLRQQAADRLAKNILKYNTHLSTGFLGTPFLCHVLSRFGYTDLAFELLLQESYPSWLYPVKMGATTIWERWDGIKPDSTFQNPTMNSFNHYAYGAVGDWMYRVVAGIDLAEGFYGYKKINIHPHIGGKFTHISATQQTVYGEVASKWELKNGKLSLSVEIPANTTATIFIPTSNKNTVTENGTPIGQQESITVLGERNQYLQVEVGSGKYLFESDYAN